MRKDVRLGFAVGGVLLAVILIGIIVGHRGNKKNDQVGFDNPGKNAGPANADQEGPDVTAPPVKSDQASGPTQNEQKQIGPKQDSPRRQSESGDDADKQWDLLFASTAEDPLRPETANYNQKRSDNRSRSDQGNDSSASAAPDSPSALTSNDRPTARIGAPSRDEVTPTTRPSPNVPLTHTVKQNETLSGIAKSYYGRSTAYLAILKANPGLDPVKMRPGVTINLPPASEVRGESRQQGSSASSTARKSQPPVDSSRQYVVSSGDTLSSIALKLYGHRAKSEDLYIANRDLIGSDSSKLKVGMVLKLPEAPGTGSR